jgi:nitroimidazol reductase NimA-like FMN-containing flavoprotein (pyridoxamine 5'-phosphate oxidase superfamily)
MSLARSVYRTHATDEEVADILGRREVATLGTLNEDGSVHLAYVIFLFEAGRFLVETSSVTRKARNIEARGHASMLVSGAGTDDRNVTVLAEGQGRLLRGEEASAAIRRVLEKYVRPGDVEAMHHAWSRFDDVALEITPHRWRTWTNARLRAEAEAQIGAERYGEVWLD